MKVLLIYPRWPKLERQTEFHLPPHGPVNFAATLPDDVDVEFIDENREDVDFDARPDLVAISAMLTCQTPRAWEIADRFRAAGVPVIAGGIAVTLHPEDAAHHVDAAFIGEAEGRMEAVLADLKNGGMKPVYNYLRQPPSIELVGPARRDILNRDHYNYRGVQMVDLVHASRGCRFNCFPCCLGYLGGRVFRPRPVEKVIEELESVPNNRLFFVDNSLAHSKEWLTELFTAIAPLKHKWVSHPILDDDEVLDLAAEAGCWYVYQAIFDTSDTIRNRVRRLKERGIGVEGAILLGTDDHDVDYIKRLVDFLLEIELDMAEFSILTPFPHTPIREQMEREGRILTNDWSRYTAGEVVFQPKLMTPNELQEMYEYAWDTFYAGTDQRLRMSYLFRRVIEKEMADGTLRRFNPRSRRSFATEQ